MKIAILSQDASIFSTKRLQEAGERRGHEIRVINYLRCYLNIASREATILYNGKNLESFDAVIPRIAPSRTLYGTAVVRQFEMMGVFTANDSRSISRSRDKLCCLQILAREGIGLPVTGFAHAIEDSDGLIETVGGAPLVIKFLEGSRGIGVVLAETHPAARSAIEAFRLLDANILVQEFIEEAAGEDLRCLVVDGKVVAAMKRRGVDGDFRSNLHRGGRAEKVTLSPEEGDIAVRAANAMGLRVAGVDLLRSKRGPVAIEVNSSPGLEGIEATTGVDVAGNIIDFVAGNAGSGAPGDRSWD
ncbi:30S ribosomal protein S6--L-glutamate ligase [Pannus brasiliensis CCIBt3594]|uniref:Probable alpha-L-glutamate ligase n=1 Tax=Pannus brasiliensis CCIBt3594 TaxID=1427578 RepID=A0AAW9QM18_9CHRO